MNNESKAQLKAVVAERIQQLQTLISKSVSLSEQKQQQEHDDAANLDLTVNAAIDEAVNQKHKVEFAQLQSVLIWIDSEEGGFCEECGCEIPIGRLLAVPQSRSCVQCAEQK